MAKKLSQIFVENVQYLMKIGGYTQQQVAAKGGFSQGGFSDLINNEDSPVNPSLSLVEKFAKGLGVSPQYLLTDRERPASKMPMFGPDVAYVGVVLPMHKVWAVRIMNDESRKKVEQEALSRSENPIL